MLPNPHPWRSMAAFSVVTVLFIGIVYMCGKGCDALGPRRDADGNVE